MNNIVPFPKERARGRIWPLESSVIEFRRPETISSFDLWFRFWGRVFVMSAFTFWLMYGR